MSMRRRLRTVTPVLPTEIGVHDGLSYSLWVPERAFAGVVILHGAGSCKESHHDFARAALAAGLGALAFDQRGHGQSTGAMDQHVLEEVAAMAELLRGALGGERARVALRGSSMGGYLALLGAPRSRAAAVVAICPASAEGLRRGLQAGSFEFAADAPALARFLAGHELDRAVAALEIPVLLLHAEGDERVPVEHSRELAQRLRAAESRLVTVPGGHHRSVQHDPELRAFSLRWLARQLGAAEAGDAR
jgi:uncharacterized protein